MTYDELYFSYKNFVVLMLKQFMFYAYDDSARVLSALLGYKLYESANGPASAGPDKEKIMATLNQSHVNYLISEFGEITELRVFEDNKYEDILKAAKDNLILPPDVSRDTNKTPPIVVPEEPEPIIIPEWFKVGLAVRHNSFGSGMIVGIDSKTFTVNFGNELEKRFVYPLAFEKGFLTRE